MQARDQQSAATLSPMMGDWRFAAPWTIALLVVVTAIYWETAASTVAIWLRSETFTHGFLIIPISAYLIWSNRGQLALLAPRADWRAAIVLLGLGLLWLLSYYAGVLVLQQLSLVAMWGVIVWMVLGWTVAWAMAFPLAFLIFAVPMGEELIPPMMDFTADFTVAALQLTGIPVYREGTFFEIPSGQWSVVEGCSGVRYLIAAVSLGCLYAYLTYRSLSRRLLFIAASVIVPIVANGMRAYMIVMIAHLSDMKLALGVDHFIYGWVFFGLVMLLLFWLGSFWREDDVEPIKQDDTASHVPVRPSATKPLLTMGVIGLVVAGVWPLIAQITVAARSAPVDIVLNSPAAVSAWQPAEALSTWRPRYLGMDVELEQTYQREGRAVSLYLGYYHEQRQDSELINSQNILVEQKHPVWRQVADAPLEITLDGQRVAIRQAKLRSNGQDLLVWYWYWMDGTYTVDHLAVKLRDAIAKLLGRPGDSAVVMVATEYQDAGESAQLLLQRYIDDMLPSIETTLTQAAHD